MRFSRWQSLLCPSSQIQAHRSINAQNTFVIPPVPVETQPVKAFPKTPANVLPHECVEGLDDLAVIASASWDSVEGGSGQPHSGARLRLAQSMFCHQIAGRLTSL